MKHTTCVLFLAVLLTALLSPMRAQKLTAAPRAASVTWKAPNAMADAGGDAAKVAAATKPIFSSQGKPDENSADCLNCHTSSPDQRLFARSQHKMLGVACNQCHSSHLVVAAGKKAAPQIQYPQAK